MKLRTIVCCAFLSSALLAVQARAATTAHSIPHLEKRGAVTQLIVDDKPFLALAGELHNSSASSRQYMRPIWPRLARMNLNTVLAVVTWDLTEREEGKFDFAVVDGLIEDARHYNMRLVILWFGSWKNGESSYPPYWVKTDRNRFPLVQNAAGKPLNILSPLGAASRDADALAFAALMRHIRQVDGEQHTVIGIQVENECGVLGDSRDRSPAANEAFGGPVPRQLIEYMQQHKATLIPEFRKVWEAAGAKTAGTWEEVFGRELETDEIFMAWNYAQYVGRVAAAGKAEYPLPMYVNAWLVQRTGEKPGSYPSGGPVAQVHDLWRAGAPHIDFLCARPLPARFRGYLRPLHPRRQPVLHSRDPERRGRCGQRLDRLFEVYARWASRRSGSTAAAAALQRSPPTTRSAKPMPCSRIWCP